MFPVLTTDSLLSTLGLGTLSDAISCEVEEERNGSYELTLEYPQGGVHADDIAMNTLIVAKPNFTDNPQPFRIYSITKEISGKIEVHAQHISYDLGGVVVSPTTMTGATCKQAGDYLLTGTPFTFQTDKTNSADFTVDVPSSARSWLGGKSGSLLSVYGSGEYHYDGYNVVFNAQRGTNRGVELRYGKNLTELKSEADCSNLASSVVCYYEDNGTVISGTAVSTGLVGITRELAIDVSDDYDTPPSVATLTARATQYIADHNLTAPKTNITLDFVQASKLKDRVDLCDTVSIYYEALDVSAVTKCIRTVWDVLAERYTETEFGDAKTNIADTIVEVEQVAAESVTKTTMQQAIDSATEQITGNNGGYVVLHDANNDGFPDELLIMDTADISTAVKIWRFNSSGLGYSSTGYSGTYGLAITQQGEIVCDFLTAGTLNANVIKAGILQDAANKNSWNMTTGALTITNGSINITTTNGSYDVINLFYDDGNLNRVYATMQSGGFHVRNLIDSYRRWYEFNRWGFFTEQDTADGTKSYTIAGLSNAELRLGLKNQQGVTDFGSGVEGRISVYNNNAVQTFYLDGQGFFKQFDTSGTLRQYFDNTGKLWQYDTNGKQRTCLDTGKLWQYDTNGKQRTCLEYGDIYLKNASEVTRQHLASDGSLEQYDASGVRRSRLSWGDLYLYDANGVRTVHADDASAMWLERASDNNAAYYITDTASTTRARLAMEGLRFYDANNKWTAHYPAALFDNATVGGVTPYSGRCTLLGGAYRIGNLVMVCIQLYASHTATNTPRMATIGFEATMDCPLTCIDITSGMSSSIDESIPCGVSYQGYLYMKKATNGHTYAITGVYPYYTS